MATGVFVWEIIKNRPKIKVEMRGIQGSKARDYTVYVEIKNFSEYPIKLDYYGFTGEKFVLPKDTNEEANQVLERDHIMFNFPIDDLIWKAKDDTIHPCKFFYVEDRTGKWYKKKIPDYIVAQAVLSSENELNDC